MKCIKQYAFRLSEAYLNLAEAAANDNDPKTALDALNTLRSYRFEEGVEEISGLTGTALVDALAPALGSVHGPYQGEPVLGFTEMEAIGKACQLPLVLHGGTGIPDDKIKHAIACGTCKINVNTECQLAFNKLLREFLADEKNAKIYDPRKILGPASKGIAQAVDEKMHVFGSVNKQN